MRRWLKILWTAAAALGAAATSASSADVEALLRDEAVWTSTTDGFLRRHRAFPWTWVARGETARVAAEGPLFAGRRVWEILAYFEDNRPRRVAVSLYNRGDAGPLTEAEFDALVRDAVRAVETWAAVPADPPASARVAANARVESRTWRRAPHRVVLEWSASRPRGPDGRAAFRAEYLRMDLVPAEAPAAASPATPRGELRDRVRRESNGDVRIFEVPMVDQGDKGYCAVAVLERVMRYYGLEFDQHQAAQLADTGARGTASDDLAGAAKRIAGRFRLTFRDLMETEMAKVVEEYNRRARRAKENPVPVGRVLQVGIAYGQMKPALLREVRLDQRTDRRRFFQHVRESVDRGVPPIWSVMLGIVPEHPPLPQTAGGHLRLIVGYNEERQEIFYSDTWGRGHEFKRMGADVAWVITLSLHTIAPR